MNASHVQKRLPFWLLIVSSGLHEFLDNLQRRMNAIDNAMQAAYFAIQPISNPAELDNSATVTKINIQESVQ